MAVRQGAAHFLGFALLMPVIFILVFVFVVVLLLLPMFFLILKSGPEPGGSNEARDVHVISVAGKAVDVPGKCPGAAIQAKSATEGIAVVGSA